VTQTALFLETAVRAATKAGALQKERLWGEHRIDFKGGETNLVTEVDRECEDLIVAAIRERFPDHDVIAEENDYGLHGSRYRWVIDPLDGTTNYAHGFPWFCVSIGLEIDGVVAAGVINHPMMGEVFTAERGKGAFLNGSRISVSNRKPLGRSLLATGFPYDRSDGEDNFRHFMTFQVEGRAVRRAGAAALDLAYVAAGRFEGFWEAKLKPWDVAAGRLLVEEAGGKVTNYSGEPYSIYDHRIVATNGLIHDEMLELLRGGC
jgi:myo-inositol-1(or 4)-monophosphatase